MALRCVRAGDRVYCYLRWRGSSHGARGSGSHRKRALAAPLAPVPTEEGKSPAQPPSSSSIISPLQLVHRTSSAGWAGYPEISQKPVPVNFMLAQLNIPALQILFQIVLFGTFIETGLGVIHALNERIAAALTERHERMPQWVRPVVAVGMLAFSIFLVTKLGIVSLVAKGYGTLTYVILAIYVLPILTIGLWRTFLQRTAPAE